MQPRLVMHLQAVHKLWGDTPMGCILLAIQHMKLLCKKVNSPPQVSGLATGLHAY